MEESKIQGILRYEVVALTPRYVRCRCRVFDLNVLPKYIIVKFWDYRTSQCIMYAIKECLCQCQGYVLVVMLTADRM